MKTFAGSTSEDMKDHINPTIREQPDAIILHIGSNDIGKDIDTISNIQDIVLRIKRKSSHTKILLSSLLVRQDKKKIEEKVCI